MEKKVKINVKLDPNDWHGYESETLWAISQGDSLFEINNIPFYAFELSYGDKVSCRDIDGIFTLAFIVARGGHSTYRLIIRPGVSTSAFRKYWEPLEEVGCTYEKGSGSLFAVDVPPTTDIHKTYTLLENGEANGIWDFEEGFCAHAL